MTTAIDSVSRLIGRHLSVLSARWTRYIDRIQSGEAAMGMINRRYLDLPWGDAYEARLVQFREETYKFRGEELLHEIHKQAIEAHWINMRLYYSLRNRLTFVIVAQVASLAYLLYRFGV